MNRFFSFLILGCFVSLSSFGWTQAAFIRFRGHEELTRLSVIEAADPFYSIPAENELANQSENSLILGNFAMDFPTGPGGGLDRFKSVRGVPIRNAFNSVFSALPAMEREDLTRLALRGMDIVNLVLSVFGAATPTWQDAPALQPLHFLRRPGMSAAASCEMARENVKKLWYFGAGVDESRMVQGEIDRVTQEFTLESHKFFVGAALHVIQDSFSPAHTVRTGERFERIENVCVYRPSEPVPGACVHAEGDLRDLIWEAPILTPPAEGTNTFALLKGEAKAAVQAGATFLRMARDERRANAMWLASVKADLEAIYERFTSHDPERIDFEAAQPFVLERQQRYDQQVKDYISQGIDSLGFLSCSAL